MTKRQSKEGSKNEAISRGGLVLQKKERKKDNKETR